MNWKIDYDKIFAPDGTARLDERFFKVTKVQNAEGAFITEPTLAEKKNNILELEECKPPVNYREGNFIKLPSNVDFERVISNIIDAFKNDPNLKPIKGDEDSEEKIKRKFDAWRNDLKSAENEYVISDAFWYMICKWHQEENYNGEVRKDSENTPREKIKLTEKEKIANIEYLKEVENFLKERMSKNYVNLFLSVNEKQKNSFFKNYFNILSQGVFYSFFYAFPKSRDYFNNLVKRKFLLEFSELFTGVKISNPAVIYSKWYLDLGAGNILKTDEEDFDVKAEETLKMPEANINLHKKPIREHQSLGYSKIMGKYLESNNYKTRNLVKGYKMKFSKMDKNQDEIEATFKGYMKIAEDINNGINSYVVQAAEDAKKLRQEILKIKQESQNHIRRLAKRRDEELEKGAHEYANYLVSMLNAGSNNTNSQK